MGTWKDKGWRARVVLGWLRIPHHKSNLLQEWFRGIFQVIMGVSCVLEHEIAKTTFEIPPSLAGAVIHPIPRMLSRMTPPLESLFTSSLQELTLCQAGLENRLPPHSAHQFTQSHQPRIWSHQGRILSILPAKCQLSSRSKWLVI